MRGFRKKETEVVYLEHSFTDGTDFKDSSVFGL